MNTIRKFYFLLFTGLLSIAVIAQTSDCPTLVQTALDSVDEICAETSRNQACYGNISIELQAQADAQIESFETPGDVINVSDIDTMTLAPLDELAETWGVAVMKVQANVPDTLPGQNVTFLLFGDVVIENAVEDGSDFTPMQAFYFSSGVGDTGCEEAPDNGLLIQTPDGVEEILLNVNGANMSLGSTAFLQAGPAQDNEDDEDDYELTISVLEGEGTIESYGEVQPIPAGSWVRLPADRNFNVIGAPNAPLPYENERHDRLPIQALDRRFEPQRSLTEEQINQRLAEFDPNAARNRLQGMGANLNERREQENFGELRDRINQRQNPDQSADTQPPQQQDEQPPEQPLQQEGQLPEQPPQQEERPTDSQGQQQQNNNNQQPEGQPSRDGQNRPLSGGG